MKKDKIFDTLVDMYIRDTALAGQLYCGCGREDCLYYDTNKCGNCLIQHINEQHDLKDE